MNRRPLRFITREKEWELIQRLTTIIDTTTFDPNDTAVLMVSPDYSATVAMVLAHAWSVRGEILPLIPVDVPYPDEEYTEYANSMRLQKSTICKYKKLVLVEAGIIRGGNWAWILNLLVSEFGFARKNITLVALCENVNSKTKSDYVGEYYNDDTHELMFYFEKYNKHWDVR